MQFQKNKFDINEYSGINKDNTNSNLGEMPYIEPMGNQLISPISIGGDKSMEIGEKVKIRNQPMPNRTIIQTVKNDLKNKVDIDKLVDEKPIHSIVVNMPYGGGDAVDEREKSPTTINLGTSKEEIEYNIRTINQRRSPFHLDRNNISNDSERYQQILYNNKSNNISRSPDNYPRMKEYQYFGDVKRERGGIIPLNNMSPNLNTYDDMNSLDQKNDINNNNYMSIMPSNSQRNISVGLPHRYEKKLNITATNNINNLTQLQNNSDEIMNKYKNKMTKNVNYNEIKKIMRRFSKIYDPLKNTNGILIESSQVIVPGALDDLFTNRYKVLSKMNRLSNILLSKRKRSINKYQENSNLNRRSRSRTKSRSPLNIKTNESSRSGSPFMNKMPHNKLLYVSLAMLSSKGPKAEDRIILRKMRLDKGGVVDLAQEERKKAKYKIRKIMKNKGQLSLYHTNPKYREIAAKVIQDWWKQLKNLYTEKLKKIILIQSIFRGKWVRKNMYDLLYLNYLYICFCRKIEKVLSNYIRPYVFEKLFTYQKAEKEILKNIILKKDKRDNIQLIKSCWDKWCSIIKNQNLKNKLGKQLVDIRSHKENKLNILLAFFNKWRYMTKISNIPPGKSFNIYPLHKINGLCKIMDAAKKYVQKRALQKIIKQLIKYLSSKLRENLLNKVITKRREYEINITRNTLYLWYSKILNFKKVSNEEEAKKLRLMRQKIFRIIVLNIKRRLNQRILRKYFIRFYRKTHPGSINKYILYEILRKINMEDLEENEEKIINIQGKKYKVIKTQKDLKIIRAEEEDSSYNEEKEKEDESDNEQIVDNYKDIIDKIKKRKSGEFKEGEEIPEEVKKDLDDIDKKNKKTKKKSTLIKKTKIEEKEIIKKIKKGRKKSEPEEEELEEESEKDIEELEDKRTKKEKVKPKKKVVVKYINKRKSQKRDKYEELTPPSSEEEIEESEDNIKYIKKYRPYSETRYRPHKIKKRSSEKRKVIKIRKREERTPSDEYEEIEESYEERKPKTKIIYRRRSEPIKKIRHYPKRRRHDDEENSEESFEEVYEDYKKPKKYINVEKPERKRYSKKIIKEEDSYEEEESPEDRKKDKIKYYYIKRDKYGDEYIEEEPSSEEDRKKKAKTRKSKIIKRRNKDIKREEEYEEEEDDINIKKYDNKRKKDKYELNNKIDEVGENEESEEEEYEQKKRSGDEKINIGDKRRKTKKKYDIEDIIDVYDMYGKKINNLKKYKNEEGGYDIDIYDKEGKKINDLKKYYRDEKDRKKSLPINIYDNEGRRLLDLEKYKNKEGDYDIDVYDKNGNIINDLKKYVNEEGEIIKPIYDENNRRIIDLKKYKNKEGDYDIDMYDKNGNIINDLKKYENKEEEPQMNFMIKMEKKLKISKRIKQEMVIILIYMIKKEEE